VEFPVNVTYMVYQMLVCSKKNSSAYFYSDSDDDNSLEGAEEDLEGDADELNRRSPHFSAVKVCKALSFC
jgi:hypothetical protein